MLSKEEIRKLLDCSNCNLKECIGCDITYTDRKKIKEYIKDLESKVDIGQSSKVAFDTALNIATRTAEKKNSLELENKKLKEEKQKLIEKLEGDIINTKRQYTDNTLLNIRVDGKLDTLENILEFIKNK